MLKKIPPDLPMLALLLLALLALVALSRFHPRDEAAFDKGEPSHASAPADRGNRHLSGIGVADAQAEGLGCQWRRLPLPFSAAAASHCVKADGAVEAVSILGASRLPDSGQIATWFGLQKDVCTSDYDPDTRTTLWRCMGDDPVAVSAFGMPGAYTITGSRQSFARHHAISVGVGA